MLNARSTSFCAKGGATFGYKRINAVFCMLEAAFDGDGDRLALWLPDVQEKMACRSAHVRDAERQGLWQQSTWYKEDTWQIRVISRPAIVLLPSVRGKRWAVL